VFSTFFETFSFFARKVLLKILISI
jgi:hypothetical protein